MTFEEVEEFARAWLKAWSDRDVAAVTAFYAEDCRFITDTTPGGLTGRAALAAHCDQSFSRHPAKVELIADRIWLVDGGFCIRWYCDATQERRLRGFELVLLDGRQIVHNEGYMHMI